MSPDPSNRALQLAWGTGLLRRGSSLNRQFASKLTPTLIPNNALGRVTFIVHEQRSSFTLNPAQAPSVSASPPPLSPSQASLQGLALQWKAQKAVSLGLHDNIRATKPAPPTCFTSFVPVMAPLILDTAPRNTLLSTLYLGLFWGGTC